MEKHNFKKINKEKHKRFRFDIVVFSCIITFAACFVIYMKSGDLQILVGDDTNSSKQVITDNVSGDLNGNSPSQADVVNSVANNAEAVEPLPAPINPVVESESVGMEYFDNCIFVGDSLTMGLASYNIIPAKNVIASIGMNITKIDTEVVKTPYGEFTAIETLTKADKNKIYIMLGSNGIAWLTSGKMIEMYSDFIDEIKTILPNSEIYILSIPPVSTEKETTTEGPVLNSQIDIYNSDLLKMANDKKIYFVDINTALKNNQGKLDSDKSQKDGMHFKRDTYDIMLDYIMKHVAK